MSMQAGRFVPVRLRDLIDPQTGRMQVRMVDVQSTRYAIARRYMIRLRKDDLEDPQECAALASACNLSTADFIEQFNYLVEDELPPLVLI